MTAIESIPGSLPRLWLLLSQLRLMGLGRELAESCSLGEPDERTSCESQRNGNPCSHDFSGSGRV